MRDDSSDSVHVYRAYYHNIIQNAGAARVDVSDVQMLRWRKPTLHFNAFREAFLDLAPHYYYYYYEGDRVDGPAIITPDMSVDPELSVADHPDAGKDESEQSNEPQQVEQPAHVDVDEPSRESPAVPRARSPTRKSKAKTMPHRNYRSYSDRLVLPIQTRPIGPRELRHREPVNYAELNKGKSEFSNIRTISAAKAYYPPPDLTEEEIVDLATIMARDMQRLEKDDSSSQAEIEQVVTRIYRISTLLERYVPIEDVGDDSISVGKALKIDAAMGDRKFEHSIKAEVLDNLINSTGTLEEITNEQVKELGAHTFIHTVVKCKRKLNPDGTYNKHKARTAARGDEYLRKLLARGQPPPASFSPTINALTFQFVLQVATSKSLLRATQDIKFAYLNAPLPDDMEPIITKLDDDLRSPSWQVVSHPKGLVWPPSLWAPMVPALH
jgi:hypothetical protein